VGHGSIRTWLKRYSPNCGCERGRVFGAFWGLYILRCVHFFVSESVCVCVFSSLLSGFSSARRVGVRVCLVLQGSMQGMPGQGRAFSRFSFVDAYICFPPKLRLDDLSCSLSSTSRCCNWSNCACRWGGMEWDGMGLGVYEMRGTGGGEEGRRCDRACWGLWDRACLESICWFAYRL
jgi:hypothetical protein